MNSMKYKVTWKTALLPAIGILAFLIYLYLFKVDIPTIIATAQQINLSTYFIAIVFILLNILFFSLSWRSLLSFLSVKISVLKSYLYVWYGIYIDIIIPAESVSGEILKVYLVTREESGTGGKVVASLVAQRLMSMGVNVATLLIGIGILLTETQVRGLIFNLSIFLAIITTFFLALLLLLCIKEEWTLNIINVIIKLVERISRGKWKMIRLREAAVKAAQMFHDSMKEFGRAPKTLFTSTLFYVIAWLFSLSVAYLVFLSLGYQISWAVILITSAILASVRSIPVGVPFEVGLPEITLTTLYMLLGVPPDISATATILNRILTLWLQFFIGFTAQQWLELKAIKTLKNK